MPNPNQPPDTLILPGRTVLSVTGDDAESFLQNIFTNDIRKATGGVLQYTLLLTPQGQVLHDVFLFRRGGNFLLDCETSRLEDLLKRLRAFRLRAKVEINVTSMRVLYSPAKQPELSFLDPRLEKLGYRTYAENPQAQEDSVFYSDLCISLGIPNGNAAIRYEKDFAHDVNLDRLNAFDWNKGCFIGQEVAARVEHRGLVKKRLMIVHGPALTAGHDIRLKDSAGTQGLAVLRLDSFQEGIELPEYLKIT